MLKYALIQRVLNLNHNKGRLVIYVANRPLLFVMLNSVRDAILNFILFDSMPTFLRESLYI